MSTETPHARLERAFATLQEQNITPILIMRGSTGITAEDLADYKDTARAAGTPDSWIGAHAGDQELGGAHWVGGKLCHAATGHYVQELWFSFPLSRQDVAEAALAAFEANAFYASWFTYNADGEIVGPGTAAAGVRLVLKEED